MTNTCGNGTAGSHPRDAAFVVHLADSTGPEDRAHGRVEHVRSGRAARFESVDELLRFMRQTLAELDR